MTPTFVTFHMILTCLYCWSTFTMTRKQHPKNGIAHLHKDIPSQLLAAFTLFGCDIVAHLWGIGKNKSRESA